MAKKALCMGINNYPGTDMDLRGCVNDANDWTMTLEGYGYEVTKLVDEQATKAKMIAAMADLIAKAEAGDSVIITFAGHGTYVPDMDDEEIDGLDEALCPYDVHGAGGPLTDDEIRKLFDSRKDDVHLLLISDSCHSGTVTRAAPTADDDADEIRARFMPMANWMSAEQAATLSTRALVPPELVLGESAFSSGLHEENGDLLLSGCEEGENHFSYDAKISDRFSGAFTHYALKSLQELNDDATYADWHQIIREYLPSAKYPQAPQMVGNEEARERKIFT